MTLRSKLLAMVLLPLAVVLPLLGLLLLFWSNAAFDRLLITKVQADLAVANGYFERVLGEVGAGTAAIADSHTLHLALTDPRADIVPLLQRFKTAQLLDFVNLRAPDGTLRFTDSGPSPRSDARSPAFGAVNSRARSSIEVLEPAELALLAPALRARVAVPLLPTLNAQPTPRTQEDRAMVLLSTHAVRAPDGRLLGHVQGGVLLNRNLPFIDHINEIVYPPGSLPFADWGSQGTATLFLDDVRISTNVRLFGGADDARDERAIGTRVSATVREAVLARGSTWLDRAFVVNDWYVSAYQPLADGQGRRIGMLYVGFLERPFTWLKWGALASIGVIFFAVMLGAAVVSLRWARAIFSPIERMDATMRRVEGGALDARVGEMRRDDEIGRLAHHLDELLATLQRWNTELDRKVAERTQQLEDTQAQLVRSEKLATVGQLTASIAHEVNNPIAVIQGNLDMVRELLPPGAAASVGTELRLVDEQIERMRLIVTRLLQFARPNDFAGYVETLDPVPVLEDSLVLVQHLLARSGITVQRALQPTRAVDANRQELQQVLVNLLVNAVQAMPGGGTLGLASRDEDGWVALTVTDTGAGVPPALLPQLFQPFVTRKTEGTGLGLWISRSIVERYGGTVVAANRPQDQGGGAVFSVRLRAAE